MHSWLAKVDNLSPLKAAKESFLLGSDAIRQLVYDPLLPEQMINAAEREVFFRTLLQFDSMGHTIWRALLEQANSQGNNNISTMNT